MVGDTLNVSKNMGWEWRIAGRVTDFEKWKPYQVINHLATVLDVEVDVKKLRLVEGYLTPEQEKVMSQQDNAEKDGNKMGNMWVALIRTDVPFTVLYDFAGWVATVSGYNDYTTASTFVRSFIAVFNDYNLANQKSQKVITDGSE
jgi:hypothetical protein